MPEDIDDLNRRLDDAAIAANVAAGIKAWNSATEEEKARLRRLFNQPTKKAMK